MWMGQTEGRGAIFLQVLSSVGDMGDSVMFTHLKGSQILSYTTSCVTYTV